jgi:uncharacterized membrane protein YozB (DUF420 family)
MKPLLGVLPHLNAFLNSASVVFLLFGLYFIRKRDFSRHRKSMLGAFLTSSLFLISYILYHSLRTYYVHLGPTRFTGQGWIRPVYFAILTSHTILAAIIGPVILVTLYRALKGRFELHRRLARWTYPIWLYVSITGVLVYVLLYHVYTA